MHRNIKDLQIGERVSGTYILKDLVQASTKDGKPYTKMTISDETGDLKVNMWEVPANFSELVAGGLVEITFLVGSYKDVTNGTAERINFRDPFAPGLDPGIIPMAPTPPQMMYDSILKLVDKFQDEDLKKLVNTAFEERKKELLICPAAQRMHQAVVGGLLWHIIGLLKIASGMVTAFPEVNRDLLYAGIILHDIGKIDEYTLSPLGLVSEYSEAGRLEGHLYIGALYVRSLCERLGINEEKKTVLEHMILSHHGKLEWGAVAKPQTLEAYIMHKCDEVDATMFQYLKQWKNLEPGQFATEPIVDGIRVYRPKI